MSNVPAIKGWLQSDLLKNQVAQALPSHLTPDRFMRIAMTAVQKTPKLMNCSQASLFSALITCSELGIEPDGRRAHLIPYGNQCQLIIDYKGLVELVMRSGEISMIHADVVCENDEFEFNMGEIVTHKINFKNPRGEAYAVYAVATLKDGNKKAEVMTRAEVEKIRANSKAANSGPWKDHWNEMAKKTVFRRLSKWLPLSPELKDRIGKDDDQFDPRMEVSQSGSNGSSDMASRIMNSINPYQDTGEEVEEAQEQNMEEVEVAEVVEEKGKAPSDDDIAFIKTYKKFLTDKQRQALEKEMKDNDPLPQERVDVWKEVIGKAYSKKKT